MRAQLIPVLFAHVVRGGPAGGGYSTVEDLLRFDRALRGGKLLKKESLDQLYETEKANRRLAVGYEKEVGADGAVTWHNNLYMHVVRGGPAGGGYSTVEDLFRFDQALRAEKLVMKASLDQLWRAYPELSSEGYGLGFVLDQSPVGRIVGHSGGFNGISAVLSMYLDAGYTIAAMANLGSGAATMVEGKARELIAAGH